MRETNEKPHRNQHPARSDGMAGRRTGRFKRSDMRQKLTLADTNAGEWRVYVEVQAIATSYDPVALAKWGAEVGYCCRLDQPIPFIGVDAMAWAGPGFSESDAEELAQMGFKVSDAGNFATLFEGLALGNTKIRIYPPNMVDDAPMYQASKDWLNGPFVAFDSPIAAAAWLLIEVSNG